MKLRFALSIVLLTVCVCVYGQQQKNTPTTKQLLNELTLKVSEQQVEITTLQAENSALRQQYEKLEKEVQFYREDLNLTEATINNNLSHWLAFLSIIVAILAGALGVVSPLYINRSTIEAQQKYHKRIVEELKEQSDKSSHSLARIEELSAEIQGIKEQIETSKTEAQEAAKKAKASEIFSQAVAEKDPHKAIELYTESIKQYPHANAYYNRGIIRSRVNDSDGAFSDFDKAIQLDPEFAEAYNNRGTFKKERGEKEGAFKDFQKAIELDPNCSSAYVNRGIYKKELGDLKGAMADYNKAIETDPNSANAYNNRADLFSILKDLPSAINDINKSIELDKTFSVAYFTKGEIHMLMGKYDLAIDDFTNAISLSNSYANEFKKQALLKRAECYDKLAGITSNEEENSSFIDKAKTDRKEASTLS